MADDLQRLSLKDLLHLEQEIHQAVGRIRAKKDELFLEELEELKEKRAHSGDDSLDQSHQSCMSKKSIIIEDLNSSPKQME